MTASGSRVQDLPHFSKFEGKNCTTEHVNTCIFWARQEGAKQVLIAVCKRVLHSREDTPVTCGAGLKIERSS